MCLEGKDEKALGPAWDCTLRVCSRAWVVLWDARRLSELTQGSSDPSARVGLLGLFQSGM